MSDFKQRPKGFSTKAIHVEEESDSWANKAITPPIVTTAIFRQNDPDVNLPNFYSRIGNPTRGLLEKCLASLDGGKYGIAFSSGQGATSSVAAILQSGDHILCANGIYSGTSSFLTNLKKNGIECDSVDFTDLTTVKRSMRNSTRMVWMESPSNPKLCIVDIEEICKIAHSHPNVIVVVDNTFLTPYYQRPLALGADICYYSLSKYMNGHSDVIMGAVVLNDDELFSRLKYAQINYGAVPSPFDCYQVIRSLKTLELRMERHGKSSLKIAQFLSNHSAVEKVLHPGLPSHPQHELALKQSYGHSGMIAFYVSGGFNSAKKFLQSLKVIILSGSLGGCESVASIPYFYSSDGTTEVQRQELGIVNNLVRLSVGLEDVDDLIRDLDESLHLSQL